MRTLLLSALNAIALSAPLSAIDSSLTYQGTLEDAGAPASGAYDLEFKLQDTAGTQVGNTLTFDNVPVTGGVFTVALDFGNAAFTGPDRFLVIAVRPGASGGTYTALAPRTRVSPAPYAQLANDANFAASVANDAIGSAQIANASILSADVADGTLAGVDIADGSIAAVDINSAQVQRRVASTCAAGQAIRVVAADGSVTCESATGAQGPAGPQGPAGATGPQGVAGPQGATGPTGPQGAAGSADAWGRLGNAATNPATNFIGTTDSAAFVVRANGSQVARFSRGSGTSANIVMGASTNTLEAGTLGATVSGGGAGTSINRVTDSYGTVAGGLANEAGSDDANVNDALGATVSGGSFSSARGAGSVVAGGSDNTAMGIKAVVPGGSNNCAGGSFSWAGGRSARIRPSVSPTEALSAACQGLSSYPGGFGDDGTFIWADNHLEPFESSGSHQFLIRVDGGVGINTNVIEFGVDDLVLAARAITGDADSDLVWRTRAGKTGRIFLSENTGGFQWNASNVTGGNYVAFGNGARLTAGGTFTNASSRVLKEGFAAVDPEAILGKLVALPISTWTYKTSSEGTHLGPMAEDFKQTFGLAGDGKSISTVDADGVALAAIQGLNAKLDAQNAALRAQVDALLARVASLESTHTPPTPEPAR